MIFVKASNDILWPIFLQYIVGTLLRELVPTGFLQQKERNDHRKNVCTAVESLDFEMIQDIFVYNVMLLCVNLVFLIIIVMKIVNCIRL